jgi:uncharacterized protein (TIGR00369 family)
VVRHHPGRHEVYPVTQSTPDEGNDMTTLQQGSFWPPACATEPVRYLDRGSTPAAPALDVVLEEISHGRAVFTTHARAMGDDVGVVANGGVCSTLLDLVLAATVQSTLPAGAGYRVLEFKMNTVHPECALAGRIEAIGEIVGTGQRVVTAGGRIVDATGAMRACGSLVALVDMSSVTAG